MSGSRGGFSIALKLWLRTDFSVLRTLKKTDPESVKPFSSYQPGPPETGSPRQGLGTCSPSDYCQELLCFNGTL